jgi:hypothetical protein
MLLATSILPKALGIEWGMSREQCLSLMSQTQKGQLKCEGGFVVLVRNGEPIIELSFDAQGKLEATNSVLRQSRHWFVDYDPDEVESIWEEYMDYYNHVVQCHSEVLGPPGFSGNDTIGGFPRHMDASIAAYWDHPEGRILIGIDHREQRMPIVTRVAVTHLEPSVLGLKWGNSKEQCLAMFSNSLLRQAPNILDVNLALQDETYKVSLWVDEREGLTQIEVVLYESQWFWNCSMDEVLATNEEYEAYYEDL